MLPEIINMLEKCDTVDSVFPSTVLYNEDWMIRITIDWFSKKLGIEHQFSLNSGSKWYSEANLPTRFSAISKSGDDLAEKMTQSDISIGNFTIGNTIENVNKSVLQLTQNAKQFVVIEAKINSPLKKGTTNIENYDQVARTVACMAETLSRAEIKPDSFEKLGFYVIAPNTKIEKDTTFKSYTKVESIEQKVSDRVESYRVRTEYPEKKKWFDEWFKPMLKEIKIECFSWEKVIEFIQQNDPKAGNDIHLFYENCKKYNS